MGSRDSITAVILAKNEQDIIAQCIESLNAADRIIVGIDTTTTDNTESVVSGLNDIRIEILKIDVATGFANAKNHLIESVRTPWCLIIDADETIESDLSNELAGVTEDEPYAAYNIDFDTKILGRVMLHGGWQETHTRLVRPDKCRYSSKLVHEELIVDGSVGKLKGRILHNTHRTIESVINKVNLYSNYEAHNILGSYHRPITSSKMVYEGVRHFIARYIVRQGWRDGTEGLIEAVTQAYSYYIQWAKAWELQRKQGGDR